MQTTSFQPVFLKACLSGSHDLKGFYPQIIRPGVRREFMLRHGNN
jgi:hypothetical protein